MAYIPTSNNPHITTPMLRQGLYMTSLRNGPAHLDKVKSSVLVIDSIRKKVLALSNNDTIAFDINMVDIVSVVCPDAAKIKEERHRLQIATKNGDIYDFYIGIPYQCDPLPFISKLQTQIRYAQNPATEVRDNKVATIASLIACIGFFVWTIVDWTNGGTIGWGIITLFLSIACGMAAYHGFNEWKNW